MASHTHREPNHTDFHGAQPFYVGYEGNVRTAVNLALSTQKDPVGPICCFAFGFPGVGKGEFCKALAWELNRVSKFSVVEADCLDIADSPFPQFRRKMDDLEETLWFSAAYPMVLVLDEIDAIAPDRAEGPLQAQTVTTYSSMRIPKTMRQKKLPCLILAVTNHPNICDATVRSEMGEANIYFDAPSPSTIASIIAGPGPKKRRGAKQIAQEYIRLSSESGTVPMVRPLIQALDKYQRLSLDQAARPPAQVAEILHGPFGEIPRRDEFEEYKRRNQRRIDQATALRALLGKGGASC